jgi:GNAT superfamily N-acetyltransferase
MTAIPHARWRVRDAHEDDIGAIARTMSDAFADDPVMAWMFPHRETRAISLLTYFELVQRHLFIPRGMVLTTYDHSGAAFWVRPGVWPPRPLDAEPFSRAMSTLFEGRAPLLDRGLSMMDQQRPHQPHFYLAGIGTAPARQSRGIGSSLMEHVLVTCDRDGFGAYLEASTERNAALYERLGFTICGELNLPGHRRVVGPHLWLMWRPPN